jgi:hypothetical protein
LITLIFQELDEIKKAALKSSSKYPYNLEKKCDL